MQEHSDEPVSEVKILFRFYSETLEETMVESLWAYVEDGERGLYKIGNIPFYVPDLASGDIVFAEFDDDECALTFRQVVQPSGNSTIQVIVMNSSGNVEDIREAFLEMGCGSEGKGSNYFVMEVLEGMEYGPVKLKLEQLSGKGVLDYAEVCLRHGY